MNRLLAALPADLLARLETWTRSFKPGETLLAENEAVTRIYFPIDSVASVTALLEDGRTIGSGLIGREGVVGSTFVEVDGRPHGRAIAQIGGRFTGLPMQRARRLFAERTDFRSAIIRFRQSFMAQVIQNVACSAAHDAPSRLARWLLMCLDRLDGEHIPSTHEFMAETLGIARPTVSLIVADFEKAGLIQASYGTIQVLNRAGLEKATCHCYRLIQRTYRLGGFLE